MHMHHLLSEYHLQRRNKSIIHVIRGLQSCWWSKTVHPSDSCGPQSPMAAFEKSQLYREREFCCQLICKVSWILVNL